MIKGFVHFHNACNSLRHLLIAAGCLQAVLETEGRRPSAEDAPQVAPILHKMDALACEILASMEYFAGELEREGYSARALQCLSLTQDSIADMVNAIVDTSQSCAKVCEILTGDALPTVQFHIAIKRSLRLRDRLNGLVGMPVRENAASTVVTSMRSHP